MHFLQVPVVSGTHNNHDDIIENVFPSTPKVFPYHVLKTWDFLLAFH